MKVITTIRQRGDAEAAVALGFFDGVHIAHQKIINTVVSYRRTKSLVPTVMTFELDIEPENKKGKNFILPNNIKYEIFARHGIEQVYSPNFSEIMSLSAESFFYDVLLDKLRAKILVCGYNYTFGNNASGNTDDLMKLCIKNNVELQIVNPIKVGDEIVSSTSIRKALSNGNIEKVTKMLASNYFIKGAVVKGKQLGRALGFPTANIEFLDNQVIPKYGVYKTLVYIGSRIYAGLTNVGMKPTVGGTDKPISETYILDFDADIYGEVVVIGFVKMLREEKQFSSIEELKLAMIEDLRQIT